MRHSGNREISPVANDNFYNVLRNRLERLRGPLRMTIINVEKDDPTSPKRQDDAEVSSAKDQTRVEGLTRCMAVGFFVEKLDNRVISKPGSEIW